MTIDITKVETDSLTGKEQENKKEIDLKYPKINDWNILQFTEGTIQQCSLTKWVIPATGKKNQDSQMSY